MIRGDFMLFADGRHDRRWTPHGRPDWAVRALAGAPLFKGVSRRHLRDIVELIAVREYGRRVRVVHAGSRGDAFHIVLEGQAFVELPGGDEVLLGPGDDFGELALIDGAPRSATVIAGEGLITGRIARADFRRLLREEPAVAVGLLPGLVGIVQDLEGEATRDGTVLGEKPASDAASGGPAAAVDGRDLLGWMLALRHMPLFAPLSQAHLRRVARLFAVRKYRDGSVLVREGRPGGDFFVVLGGTVRVERSGAKAHELGPGRWFGELSLIDRAPRAATVTACAETTVASLPHSAFQKLLTDEPHIALGLVTGLVALIRSLQQE